MPSEAGKRIRAAFSRDGAANDRSIDDERRGWQAAAAQTALLPGARFEPLNVDGVACAWVRYADSDTGALLFVHGGGFNAGSAITHRELGARLAAATKLPVLLVEYRLAPEHPFPAGLADILTVYRALLARGYAAADLVIGGDSAGGVWPFLRCWRCALRVCRCPARPCCCRRGSIWRWPAIRWCRAPTSTR